MQPSLPFDIEGDVFPGRSVGERPPAAPGDTGRLAGLCPPTFIRHPRARRYVVRVRADGTVRVTIPRWGSRREAERFASSQRAWIERQLLRLAMDAEAPRDELSPEIVRGLRARAVRELPTRLLDLATRHGLHVSRVSVRNQQWRWGSCSPSGHICLNWRLVQMPSWVSDYVMIHELMHLRRMDHSPKFWKLVERACPQHREARLWLRRNQALLTR